MKKSDHHTSIQGLTWSIKIRLFPRPTGYMLTSFGFLFIRLRNLPKNHPKWIRKFAEGLELEAVTISQTQPIHLHLAASSPDITWPHQAGHRYLTACSAAPQFHVRERAWQIAPRLPMWGISCDLLLHCTTAAGFAPTGSPDAYPLRVQARPMDGEPTASLDVPSSAGGKLVRVILNSFTLWLGATKRSRKYCSSQHLSLFTSSTGTCHQSLKVLAFGTIHWQACATH